MIKRLLISTIAIMFIASLVFPLGSEYLKMVQETSDPVEITITTYISPKGYIYDWGEGSYLLYVMAESKFYLVNNDDKEYFLINIDHIKPILDQVNEKTWGEDPTVSSENTGQKENINGLDTEIWKFQMKSSIMSIEIKTWNSTKYLASPVVYKYYEELGKLQGKRGLLTLELMKSSGFPIKEEMTAIAKGSTMKIITITTDISDNRIPDSIFEIPKDYVKAPVVLQILIDAILQ